MDNKVGAGGAIASDFVAKSKSDGYTLFLPTITSQVMSPLMKTKLRYDPVKDFDPISLLVSGPYAFVAPANAPFNNIKEMLAYSRSLPTALSYNSAGPGSAHHLIGDYLEFKHGGKFLQMPYKSDEMGLFNDMMGGTLESVVWAQTVARNVRPKIKVMGVTGSQRNSALPDISTMLEQGFPGLEVTGWIGLYAPAGTPKLILEKVAVATREILHQAHAQVRMTKFSFDTITNTPEEFRTIYARDYQRWNDMVKAAGIVPDQPGLEPAMSGSASARDALEQDSHDTAMDVRERQAPAALVPARNPVVRAEDRQHQQLRVVARNCAVSHTLIYRAGQARLQLTLGLTHALARRGFQLPVAHQHRAFAQIAHQRLGIRAQEALQPLHAGAAVLAADHGVHFLNGKLDDLDKDVLLVLQVVVNGGFGDIELGSDIVDGSLLVAAVSKHARRRLDNEAAAFVVEHVALGSAVPGNQESPPVRMRRFYRCALFKERTWIYSSRAAVPWSLARHAA